MSNSATCERCGGAVGPEAAQGLCPACLLAEGLRESRADTVPSNAAASAKADLRELAQLFPQLEIIELVGRGGMGVVYKGRQRGLDRPVALKILPPGVDRNPGFQERFIREARALARLNHPNIVAVYDFGQAQGRFYFLMEYVDGANLRVMLQGGRLTPQQALAILPQLCDALQFAHEEGIVHRDIKPEHPSRPKGAGEDRRLRAGQAADRCGTAGSVPAADAETRSDGSDENVDLALRVF